MNGPIRVGFVLANSASWVGGRIYLLNLIDTVMSLPDPGMTPVLILSTPGADVSGFEGIETITTPLVGDGLAARLARRGSETLLGRNLLFDRFLCANRIDLLSHSGALGVRAKVPSTPWLPDFQHVRMPGFFSDAEIAARDRAYGRMAAGATTVIVSSEDARADLARFAPAAAAKTRVLRFVAGMVRSDDGRGLPYLASRYGIAEDFFYLPNQFWKHKNHRLVIDALGLLATRGKAPLVVSTGKTEDRRNPRHFGDLMRHAAEAGVADRFKVLGLIPYEDLSVLMRNAVAVINPSRFEGWSTTVEEAKSTGKHVILSDIPVHREQDPERACYVAPGDPSKLAAAMAAVLSSWSPREDAAAMAAAAAHLPERRRAFGETFRSVVRDSVRANSHRR